MNFSYVILHYFSAIDTINCINSILRINNFFEDDNHIIVVDNASPNDSLELIRDVIGEKEFITYIRSSDNLGFARGNNLGISYAKKHFNPDFIVALNNDTVIEQSNFQDIVEEKFAKTNFFVMGPDILTKDGFHQNPGTKQEWTMFELRKLRFKRRLENLILSLKIDFISKRIIEKKKNVYRNNVINHDIKDTILHGACLIFSKGYIDRFKGFYDKTFMYMEEDILKLMSCYYGFLMLYTPDLKITHKEEVSSKLIYSNDSERIINKNKMLIDSTYIYEKLKRSFYG